MTARDEHRTGFAFDGDYISAIAGACVFTLIVLAVIAVPLLSKADPNAVDILNRFSPPGSAHPFGTDQVGRDVFLRVIYGGRASLAIATGVVTVTALVGAAMGFACGLAGGLADSFVMRVADVVMALPALVLAMALSAALGPSLVNVMIALAFVRLPLYVRLSRASALDLTGAGYVESARLFGASQAAILRRHILPNASGPILVQATLDVGFAVLAAASLSFIGLGAQPPTPEWGAMIGEGRDYFFSYWWLSTFPGVAILLVALSVNFMGDGLRHMLERN